MQNKLIFSGFLFCLFSITHAQSQMKTSGHGELQIVEEPGIHEMHEAYILENGNINGMEGYRVQIYNGRKDACMAERSRFAGIYQDVPVYTLYEAPEYRIQTGDFRTQLEAEKFLSEIIEEFSGSFVVRTRIKLPKLAGEEVIR